MEHMLLICLPKEIVTAIMFYKNVKAMVHSLDVDNNFFDIVSGVLLVFSMFFRAITLHFWLI